MSQVFRVNYALVASGMVLALSVSAQAGLQRTFVSTTGDDANTSASCAASAPCRTFAAALSVTNPGGEIVVLTSGGYGPATISQPVVITAIGVNASISTVTSGANGLTINTGGNVTLIGLNLHGEAMGHDGILVQQAGLLRIYNTLIENFTNDGLDFQVSGSLTINDSEINDNNGIGVVVNNASAKAFVRNTSFDNNSVALDIIAGQANVVDSSAENNSGGGFTAVGTGSLSLSHDRLLFNGLALETTGSAALYFANCLISSNTMAYFVGSGSTMAGTSPGTSLLSPGQTTSGTLSSPIAVQ
jgi:hypothetical protein